MEYSQGDTVYFIESNRFIKEAVVMKKSGNLYTLRFRQGGGIRLRGNRLFASQEEAEMAITKTEPKTEEKRQYRSPYEYWH